MIVKRSSIVITVAIFYASLGFLRVESKSTLSAERDYTLGVESYEVIEGESKKVFTFKTPVGTYASYVLECGAGSLAGLCYGNCRCSVNGKVLCSPFTFPKYPLCDSYKACTSQSSETCPLGFMCECSRLDPAPCLVRPPYCG